MSRKRTDTRACLPQAQQLGVCSGIVHGFLYEICFTAPSCACTFWASSVWFQVGQQATPTAIHRKLLGSVVMCVLPPKSLQRFARSCKGPRGHFGSSRLVCRGKLSHALVSVLVVSVLVPGESAGCGLFLLPQQLLCLRLKRRSELGQFAHNTADAVLDLVGKMHHPARSARNGRLELRTCQRPRHFAVLLRGVDPEPALPRTS